jgi:hypothetical protein
MASAIETKGAIMMDIVSTFLARLKEYYQQGL